MKRILIVEDENRIRKIYKRLLSAESFVVFEAKSAEYALSVLTEEAIDLVLLDINLPGVGGSALNKFLYSLNLRPKVIIASVLPVDEQKRIIPDAADYYDKSGGIELLLTKVKEAFKNGRSQEDTNC